MCGIAGILRLGQKPVEPGRLKPMCDALEHRGPDDAGYAFFKQGHGQRREGGYWAGFADEKFRHVNEHLPTLQGEYSQHELPRYAFDLALGHRRLSIIDLTHYGHQPMSSSDRRHWVVYNGEIYNFPELKRDLESQGHVFRTRSDTEVLLHLWEENGSGCLLRLDGMFAFAIYDRMEGTLTLARDRFGVKPLYYADTGEYLVFASEPKAILASGILQATIDPQALAEYMTFQNIFSERTLFEGIRMLPSGHFLEVSVDGSSQKPAIRAYHESFPSPSGNEDSFEATADRVTHLFTEAVSRQLISDVPVGAYLSGGMDSGSIVSVARRAIPRLLTFTGGFDLTNVSGIEQGFDERPIAEKLSYLLQTEHYAVVLHAGDMPAVMERLTWYVDDPRLGMCHQNWYVAKLASRFVKVCLAGAGGDELFGGYPWRYRPGLSSENAAEFDDRYYAYWHRLLPPGKIASLFQPSLRPYLNQTRDSFQSVLKKAPAFHSGLDLPANLIQRALYFEFKTFLHGFLIIEDRMSMAHSLESRVPFLDNALADMAWNIPAHFKLNLTGIRDKSHHQHLETADGKLVLRRAMSRLLPAEFTSQKKQGFSPPDHNWYRGPSMNYIKEILFDPRTAQRPWFQQDFLRATLEEHFSGQNNHRLLIWSLLSLEWLQRHFVDKK